MDAVAKGRWSKEVAHAWWTGDEDRMRQLCRDYDVSVDPDDPLGTVTITASPTMLGTETIEFTVVKAPRPVRELTVEDIEARRGQYASYGRDDADQ